LDAVILVGGVPYPALDKFGMEQIKQGTGLFSKTSNVAQLSLLPVGEEANAAIDHNPDFQGYFKTTIKADESRVPHRREGEIETRGVTACLVTHSSYSVDAKTEDNRKKLLWVRHVYSAR